MSGTATAPAADPPDTRTHHLERLLHRAQFEAVLAKHPVVKTPHFALHVLDPAGPGGQAALFLGAAPWLGVLLPKRWAKRAVTRNTLRRQIYATAHGLQAQLPNLALVVRLRAGFSRTEFVSATSTALKQAARAELLHLLGAGLAAWQSKMASAAPRPVQPATPAP